MGKKIYASDAGTTNSLISAYDSILKRGKCFENEEGGYLTASAVCFHKNKETTVGNAARDYMVLEPDRVAQEFKRLMGKTLEAITVDDVTYSPQQLTALVLKRLIQDVERAGEKVEELVITVPAYFDHNSRQATYEAGALAGVEVRDIIDEPTAALTYAAAESNLENKYCGVIDVGGGTTDCVVAYVEKDAITEKVICGDLHLGGVDWDKAFIKYIKETYLKEHTLGLEGEQELVLKTEMAKRNLTEREKTTFTVGTVDDRVEITVTRDEFEKCTKHLLEKLLTILKDMKEKAAMKQMKHLDTIVFAGGSTKMPQIQKAVKEVFPDSEIIAKDVDKAVVNGAALYAKALEEGNAKKMKNSLENESADETTEEVIEQVKSLKRVTSRSYGVSAYCGDVLKICNMVYQNDQLPITVESTFSTRFDNQRKVCIDVYESNSFERREDLKNGHMVGTCTLEINEDLPRLSPFLVTFTLEEDGTLHVRGYEKTGNTEVKATIKTGALLSKEDFSIQKDQVEQLLLLD